MKMLFKRMLLFGLAALCFLSVTAQKKQVTGTVRDADGNGVPSVTVKEKGTNNQTLTNASGTFKISVASNATLVFSSVGYETQEAAVAGAGSVDVVLKLSTKEISEVVVTSLGISKQQKSLGYAASTIKAADITKTAPTNFATALYGKAPGLQISAAPGGPTSGVYIQIRGVNSINFRSTPLIIMDGVPIHDDGFNNTNYWGDQRVRGNALLDLNPEDIENISVLKGAAAAALYGSEGTNGVVVITTKSGKGKKGFSVDFNANYFEDKVAYLPKVQNVRGAGFPVPWGVYSSDAQGFSSYTLNGTTYRTLIAGSLNFGPKFDGQPILCWDGQVRPYSAQSNRYEGLYQVAHNNTENVAITSGNENSNIRLSLTHQHSEGISIGSRNEKVTANLNSTMKLGKRYSIDLMVNYINQDIHNRPYMIDRMVNNFGGMLPVFDNGAWYQDKYQTSLGYRYVTGTGNSLTPAENLKINGYRGDILDYMWRVKKYNSNEYNNRLISSITNNIQILNNLSLRARISTDLTFNKSVDKNASEIPIAYGPSGGFGIGTNNYTILYGDVLLTYKKEITRDINLNVMGGYTADKENMYTTSVFTSGGLSTENWFDMKASYNTPYSSSAVQTSLVKDAFIGTVNLDYKNYLFVEGTVRRDRTSTMNPDKNSFVYPSVNAGFVLSDAVKLPKVFNYAKVRGSWGIVGNYPPAYAANIAYNTGNYGVQLSGTSPVLTTTTQNPFGNNGIKPEKKNEYEVGIEAKMFKNRLGFDMGYYSAKIVDQILNLSLPQSSGASSILTNIGTLQNRGFEFSLNATPVELKNFRWSFIFNYATNKNKILQLSTGSTELIHGDYDGNAYVIKSVVGQAMGDIYSHPTLVNAKGENIISDDGLYQADPNKMVKYGNAQPKGLGGFLNSFTYKNFTLDLSIDYKYGGSVIPTGLYWMTSRGITEESTKFMDAAHGGLTYYLDKNTGKGIQTTASVGPNGEVVMHDGMLLDGVLANGTKNTNVVSQAYYYWVTYNWGGPQYSPTTLYNLYIHKNNYIKMREMSLTYNLSSKLAGKVTAKKLSVSVFARNFFYLYRTIKDMDAEQLTSGANWVNNINNAGSQPSSRTIGIMLRASF